MMFHKICLHLLRLLLGLAPAQGFQLPAYQGRGVHLTIMPAKNKAKAAPKSKAQASSFPILTTWQSDINKAYLEKVAEDTLTIIKKFPTLANQDPLPLVGDAGFKGLAGMGAPFDASAYDQRQLTGVPYNAHINMFYQSMTTSVLSFVPLYWERVIELADSKYSKPAPVSDLMLLANFATGDALPKGNLIRVSPCEPVHAFIHKFACRIRENAPASELNEWLRICLSQPATFQNFTDDDAKYAEANSLREDATSSARAVQFSARQLIHNIMGFKKRKEAEAKTTLGATHIAEFWKKHIRISKGNEGMSKKSTIDTCLTVGERLFSIPEAEALAAKSEVTHMGILIGHMKTIVNELVVGVYTYPCV